MRPGQGIIQPGAFLQFGLIHRVFTHQHTGGSAAGGAYGLNFVGDAGSPANRECASVASG